jgi:hypothetical protein
MGRAVRRAVHVTGAVFVATGLTGLFTSGTNLAGWAIWFAGLAVAHDVLFVPLVLGVGRLMRRAPRPCADGLVIVGAVTLVALPAVLGFGRRPGNPSVLPQAYGLHLATIVVLTGVVTAAIAALNAYAHLMAKAILAIVGVLLSIWLIFMVVGMIISALKFLIWVGFLAVIAAVIVTIISRMAKSQ